jgi:hypothetical protein
MGWNDHDDRLMELADEFEMAGIGYERAYEMALELRTEEILDNDGPCDQQYILDLIDDEMEIA